jgi:hypothetical protein
LKAVGEKKSTLNYILNDFILRLARVVSGVLQQPIGKLLALVGVAGETLFFLIPQQTFRTGNARIAFHFYRSYVKFRI